MKKLENDDRYFELHYGELQRRVCEYRNRINDFAEKLNKTTDPNFYKSYEVVLRETICILMIELLTLCPTDDIIYKWLKWVSKEEIVYAGLRIHYLDNRIICASWAINDYGYISGVFFIDDLLSSIRYNNKGEWTFND